MGEVHLLVSGIPATAKSAFARWLATEQGYLHVDGDHQAVPAWRQEGWLRSPRLVIDWGFPAFEPSFATCADVVSELVTAGVQHFWFDGDRDAAFQSFMSRATVSKEAWDRQMNGIQRNWEKIDALFAGRQIHVIFPGPRYLTNREKLEAILSAGASS